MAAEAEAAREARAKVIAAEGEHKVTTNNNKCENYGTYIRHVVHVSRKIGFLKRKSHMWQLSI